MHPAERPASGKLKRGLKARHLQFIALGGIIGSSYFLGNGYVIGSAGPAAVLSYLLGGAVILCVMLCLGELAVARPVSGSFITYAADFISPHWACGIGWAYWLTWVTFVPSEMVAGGIIMNYFFPDLPAAMFSVIFMAVITAINLLQVAIFGEMEFWLALCKISALVAFACGATMIVFGVVAGNYIGSSILLGEGGFFPNGILPVFLVMVIVLNNFQGSEIIGLAAAESKNPGKTIPKAIKNVVWRICAIFVLPLLLLVSILPWNEATVADSPFARAISHYGLHSLVSTINFVIVTAAISASNSGLYAGARALFGMAGAAMAPGRLSGCTEQGVPKAAIIFTIAFCWLFLLVYFVADYFSLSYLYENLLALSGFTGAMSWISISWCQLNFRKWYMARNNCTDGLLFRTPWHPWPAVIAIVVQVICILMMPFTEQLRIAFYLGLLLFILPMVLHRYLAGRARRDNAGTSRS
ncbi:MAG: amino acid permease [Negativicutes bacterium]|nr:amino acid permease [Negativicutes bacterium]